MKSVKTSRIRKKQQKIEPMWGTIYLLSKYELGFTVKNSAVKTSRITERQQNIEPIWGTIYLLLKYELRFTVENITVCLSLFITI